LNSAVSSVDFLALHVASTWALVGLVWIVQVVIYPPIVHVGSRELPAFHEARCRRITWIVAPLMGAELVTGIVLLTDPPPGAEPILPWLGASLMAVNGWCTGQVSMPLHGRLVGRDRTAVQAPVVATNWIRTVAWSLRGGWCSCSCPTARPVESDESAVGLGRGLQRGVARPSAP
jgi:hypothetical protein